MGRKSVEPSIEQGMSEASQKLAIFFGDELVEVERKGIECSHILTKSACIVCIIFYIRLMDLWKHVKMLTSMSFENFM